MLTLAFGTVYFSWGASFVATKVMVTEVPPLLASGLRFFTGGLVLMAIAAWRGAQLPRDMREWRHILVMALLAVVLSNTFNVLGMNQGVASNQSALLNATAAFWIALLGTLGAGGVRLGKRGVGGMLLGFAGVAMVMSPSKGAALSHLGWQLAILFGCMTWAGATAYFRHVRPTTAPLMFTGLQMVCGGLMVLPTGLLMGEPMVFQWSLRGFAAFAYLVVFSSCLAYSCFAYLMVRVSPTQLGTYAYVNPLVATILGWWLLGEVLSPIQWLGAAVILTGVAVVNLPASAPGQAD